MTVFNFRYVACSFLWQTLRLFWEDQTLEKSEGNAKELNLYFSTISTLDFKLVCSFLIRQQIFKF